MMNLPADKAGGLRNHATVTLCVSIELDQGLGVGTLLSQVSFLCWQLLNLIFVSPQVRQVFNYLVTRWG